MIVFTKAVEDFKNRFIYNNIKRVEYDSLDYASENEDNIKLIKALDLNEYICSFNTNVTTFIYKAKMFFIVKSFLYIICKKENRVTLNIISVHHTNYNNNCKTKLELMKQHSIVFENINIENLEKQLQILKNLDVLTKKDDKHFNALNANIELEFRPYQAVNMTILDVF